ncbi:ATP-binding protein [Streptomyces sp. NPDC001985]|uniref:ATP-binding protein n=1 Tax=Streptomyces sp. NPDC001985 TaxID=3154406 RepID=UPI00332D687A
MRFTAGEHSACHLRRIIRAYLKIWTLEELTDSAESAVTELLANVVRHVPDRRCALVILRLPWGVRVEVSDGWHRLPESPAPDAAVPALVPAPAPVPARAERVDPFALEESGRGLLLVEAVADRWGVVPLAAGGKTVWFECEAKKPAGL